MSSSLSPSPCPCSHPHSPAYGIVPGICDQHSKASLASGHKGTMASHEQLLRTLSWCCTAGPWAQGKPRESLAELLQPSEGTGLVFRDSQCHNLSTLPHPHLVWWLLWGFGCQHQKLSSFPLTKSVSISSAATSAVCERAHLSPSDYLASTLPVKAGKIFSVYPELRMGFSFCATGVKNNTGTAWAQEKSSLLPLHCAARLAK